MFQLNDIKSLITVIIPIYNGEMFLSACIESVLKQSYSHWELLLMDDGSTDRSAEICERYVSLDSRIFLFRLPHGGVSVARNAGLAHGHGDYFFFLDCDDLIHPQALEAGLYLMQTHGCAIACLTLTNVDADFKLSEHAFPLVPKCRFFSPPELRNLFGNHRTYKLWAIGGKLLARSAVDGFFFPETISSGEDTIFLLDVIARNETPTVILTETSYFRRLHQNNTFYLQTFELKMNNIEAYLHLRARHFELYGTPGCWELLCVSKVFNWFIDAQENPVPECHANELYRKLQELLHDDYARFLPLKRKCTIKMYLFSPPLYWFLKKLYWRIHMFLTGKGDPALE